MDNAVDALHIAFVAMVLIIALSVAVYMITLARQTSEIVLTSSDDTSYLSYETTQKYSGISSENRIVGFETVIPTLFKYNFERYAVVFMEGSIDGDTGLITAVPEIIYDTDSNIGNWSKNSKFLYYEITNDEFRKELRFVQEDDNSGEITYNYGTGVYTFDITEESYRNECWVGSNNEIKKHLKAILFGEEYVDPQTSGDNLRVINYHNNKLSEWYKDDAKFVEFVGHFTTNESVLEDTPIHKVGNNTTSKTVIVYVHIN